MESQNVFRKTANSATVMGLSYIMLGFALVAALAWMALVRFLIKTYVPVPGSAGMYLFLYAIIVTILAAIVYSVITRYADVPVLPIIGVLG
jgi:hypothetical protein